MNDFWGPPISVYTREQAIEDGVLIEVPADIAREHGILIPTVITVGVHAILAQRPAAEYTVWLRDILNMAVLYSRPARQRGSEGPFSFPVTIGRKAYHMVLGFSGHEGFTIMLPGED